MKLRYTLAVGIIVAMPVAANAQVAIDGTSQTQVRSVQGGVTVEGGDRVGGNLLHSFREFSVQTGSQVHFNNTPEVDNIFSRVTGSAVSDIDGTLAANGGANLFLVNPNGIIFGPNAKLDIGGSFLATTASQVLFADGSFLDATDPQGTPLLTISVPVGLQMGQNPGSITTLATQGDFGGISAGLEVREGQTIALIGSGVFFPGGKLNAPAGRIEIGSLESGDVTLELDFAGFKLSYEAPRYGDITLSGGARLNTSSNLSTITDFSNLSSSGFITLNGKNISLSGASEIAALNDGIQPGGDISISATGLIVIDEGSDISAATFTIGKSGNINFESESLRIANNSLIAAISAGEGQGGTITIITTKLVEVTASGQIAAQAFSTSNAGAIAIETDRLVLSNGGRLSNDTLASGNGGAIAISANSIEISGIGPSSIPSSISTGSLRANPNVPAPTGNGGSVDIESDRLTVADGGQISVASEGEGAAGNISIATDVLRLERGGTMNASTRSPGAAQGNIELAIGDILLIRGGAISTESPEQAGSGNVGLRMGAGGLALGVENIEPSGGVLTVIGRTGGLDFAELEIDLLDEDELIAQGGGCFEPESKLGRFEIIKSGSYRIDIAFPDPPETTESSSEGEGDREEIQVSEIPACDIFKLQPRKLPTPSDDTPPESFEFAPAAAPQLPSARR